MNEFIGIIITSALTIIFGTIAFFQKRELSENREMMLKLQDKVQEQAIKNERVDGKIETITQIMIRIEREFDE